MEIDRYLEKIGERIRMEREAKNLTQKELAEMMVPPREKSYVSKLERGKFSNPTLQKLLALANALEINLWDLLTPIDIQDTQRPHNKLQSQVQPNNRAILIHEVSDQKYQIGYTDVDPAIRYFNTWRGSKHVFNRLDLIIEAYKIIRQEDRLKNWIFAPGRKREGGGYNPMYCAFAATPFDANDWFILRLVRGKDLNVPSDVFAIGFCTDYGMQDKKGSPKSLYFERRKIIKKEIKRVQREKPNFMSVPFPVSENRPHAYKGFEHKFTKPSSANELAEKFIKTVLEWENLFRLIL